MAYDIFTEKKCVHIKFDKRLHSALRQKLFLHDISMQQAIEGIAELVLEDNSLSDSILKRISRLRMIRSLEKIDRRKELESVDKETLYSLLETQEKYDTGINKK